MLHLTRTTKRYSIIILVATTLLIAGCGKSAQNVSFNEGYDTLTKKLSMISMTKPVAGAITQDITTINIQASSSQGFTASGTLISSGIYASGNAVINLGLDANAFEPSFNSSVIISGAIRLAHLNKNTYGYIENILFKPLTGNADGGIIQALASTMSKRRIDLTDTLGGTGSATKGFSASTVNVQAFAYHLVDSLKSHRLFREAGKTTIDGKPAYILARDPEGVSGFVQDLLQNDSSQEHPMFSQETIREAVDGILASPVVGYLIIHSSNNVTLRIDSITTNDAGILAAQIATDGPSTRSATDSQSQSIIMTGKAELSRAGFQFSNTRINPGITLTALITQSKPIQLSLTTKDVRIQAALRSQTTPLTQWQAPVITDAVPFSRIQEGFSLLGGAAPLTGELSDDSNLIESNDEAGPSTNLGTGNSDQE